MARLRRCPRCVAVLGAVLAAWAVLASVAVDRLRARRTRKR
jgi:hypothetical protein